MIHCHVVQTVLKPNGALSFSSPTAAGSVLVELERIFGSRNQPRWSANLFERLKTLMQSHGLHRLVIVWNVPLESESQALIFRAPIEIPEPLTLPFEPVLLQDGAALLSSLLVAGRVRPRFWFAARRQEQRALRGFRRFYHRAITVIGLPLLMMWMIPLLLAYAAVLLACYVSSLAVKTEWYIAPGCVVRRSHSAWSSSPCVRVFTPASSLLLIFAQQTSWSAELWTGTAGFTTGRFDDKDCAALLMAWTSPLSPPCAEDLVDLK